MTAKNRTKKPVGKDWHKSDIKAAIEKAGWSCRQLAKLHEKSHSYFSDALMRPNPKAQQIIAKIIGQPAPTIWPSRYDENGAPKRGLFSSSGAPSRD